MKLKEIVEDIANIDEDAIIFQEDINDVDSNAILYFAEEEEEQIGLVKQENGITYHYLLEVFLAKEFLDDWIASLPYSPTTEEKVKRLQKYAVNDA